MKRTKIRFDVVLYGLTMAVPTLNATALDKLNEFNKPTSKAEQTKRRILETALELFRIKGFDPTTMRDIAAACDMAVGTAYHHFDSKEAIVAAYYEEVQTEHSARVTAFLQQKHTLKQKLEQVFMAKLENAIRPNN